ncbi:MAG: hypothetical protein J6O23_03830 [Prevotella sp.]|nr:hypothetical protein [Prevotella sp.]
MFGGLLLLALFATDTVAERTGQVDEVVITSQRQGGKRAAKGQVATIDEHLSELSHVNLVRRGSYAWEPVVNNMQMERLSTTIDGMKIFYACTDKMDPVTSYVESGNLQSISLNSGLDGNPQATGNIGGALDLRLRKVGFDADPFRLNSSVGYETNGHVQVYGADAALSRHSLYTNFGAFYRHADNYKAGGGETVRWSQFRKVNAFANAGWRLAEHDVVEGTFIFDRAYNVGYPALNMDVAVAQAFITSLSYKHLFGSASWETKAYYNHITHEMDDTQRPDVQIHMDMPGRSWTAGLYSLLALSLRSHHLQLNYDLYYNRLFADMTMYPGGAAPMYMVTWPDVGTLNTGFAVTDNIRLTHNQSVRLSAKVAWQQQQLNSEEGYHALRVFFPGMTDSYHQTTARMAASYQLEVQTSNFNLLSSVGTGWGSRAPTVTEAYGYYLNNTFDQYDYMGNPSLKNESAIELNASVKLQTPNSLLTVGIDANAFFFSNYIIGEFETRLSPMTVGAKGVKVYGNQSHATVANVSLSLGWQPLRWLHAECVAAWGLGRDAAGDALPLVAPFSYQSRVSYVGDRLRITAEMKGNARQHDYAAKYGERQTAAFTVFNFSASYVYRWLTLRGGVENVFDKAYSTYADWNDIPQKGRNIYMNITFEL